MTTAIVKAGNKLYTGSRSDLCAREVEKGIYETSISFAACNYYISMLYISSPSKPTEVQLLINDTVFGICKGENLREVAPETNFEEFQDVKIISPRVAFSKPNFKTYKVVMFGNDCNLNARKLRGTESYFFPQYDNEKNHIKFRISFEDIVEDCFPSVETITREKGYLLSQKGDVHVALLYRGNAVTLIENPTLVRQLFDDFIERPTASRRRVPSKPKKRALKFEKFEMKTAYTMLYKGYCNTRPVFRLDEPKFHPYGLFVAYETKEQALEVAEALGGYVRECVIKYYPDGPKSCYYCSRSPCCRYCPGRLPELWTSLMTIPRHNLDCSTCLTVPCTCPRKDCKCYEHTSSSDHITSAYIRNHIILK